MTERMLQRVGSALVTMTISTLILFLVIAVTYSLYLFVGAIRLPDIAGVHISKNIFLEYKNLKGELYSNKDKGIENWLVFDDEKNGFKLKYPNDYEMQRVASGAELKTYNKELKGMESLAMTVFVEKMDGVDEAGIKQLLAQRGIQWRDEWRGGVIDGHEEISTGLVKGSDGIYRRLVFRRVGEDIILAEGVFYKEKPEELENSFARIVAELKIM